MIHKSVQRGAHDSVARDISASLASYSRYLRAANVAPSTLKTYRGGRPAPTRDPQAALAAAVIRGPLSDIPRVDVAADEAPEGGQQRLQTATAACRGSLPGW